MHDATVGGRADAFASPDLTAFCRLDELGLVVTGQRLEPDRAVLACQVVEPDQWCRRCGCEGRPRDTVVRRLAHEPLGWRSTTLEVVVRGDTATHIVNGFVNLRATGLKQWDPATSTWVRLDHGKIALQAEFAEIYYRNIRIRPLAPEEMK